MCWFNKNKKRISELEKQNQELRKQLNIKNTKEDQITDEYINSLGGYEFIKLSDDYYAKKEYYIQNITIIIYIDFTDRYIVVHDMKTSNHRNLDIAINNYYRGETCFTKSNLQNIINTINDLIDNIS